MQHDTMPFGEVQGTHNKLLTWLGRVETSLPETRYRDLSAEDYRFYAGEQDTLEALEALAEQKRPATVYNEVKPKVDMLIGMAAQSRREIKLLPVGSEDESLVELLTGAYKHFRKKLKLNRKELDAFEHTVKSGRSLLYFYIDKTNPFKPEIKCKRIEGGHFFVDPNSREYDLSDARFVFIEKWVTLEDIATFWPGIDVTMVGGGGRRSDMPEYFNQLNDLYRIIECWWVDYMGGYWFINPVNNESQWVTAEDFKKIKEEYPTIQAQYGVKKVYKYSIFSGMVEMEVGVSDYKMERYPFVQFGAYRDDNFNNWFGVITMMKDPQRAINAMRRQLSHLLQTLPKGMLKHEVGAVLNIEEYETNSSQPNFHLEVAKGSFEKVDFVQQPQISNIYERFDEINVQGMKDASGIQDPLMGIQTTSREPGVSMRMRQETSVAVLYMLFNNFENSRDQCCRIVMSLIQQYVTWPEVLRIEGAEGMQMMQMNTQLNPQVQGWNDITAMEYDIDTTDTAETATSRLATGQMLADFNQNNPGSIPPDLLLEYTDVPFSVKQRVKNLFNMQQQQKMQAEQHQMLMDEQDRKMKQMELEIKLKELEIKQQELGIKQQMADDKKDVEIKKMASQEKVAKQNQLKSNSNAGVAKPASKKKK
jgi:hypothetical protein